MRRQAKKHELAVEQLLAAQPRSVHAEVLCWLVVRQCSSIVGPLPPPLPPRSSKSSQVPSTRLSLLQQKLASAETWRALEHGR